ncbi:MAG: GGDEF domain-containing protein [Candidatus Dormibacteraeota bacterium]|uniref:GGDEF domain-containing protein n=1 Tax=Candidatus Dormiibacter inghamiae TaxID=3127013 RepID=A0A934KH13_9BACT|nr:GGDEF domain-containing protein [Candidatus Dormibacteraeota bacterium]MBJ7606548.1 GGDEF domain-containing protein [Candidatus Dormibacteraeota bacterium]
MARVSRTAELLGRLMAVEANRFDGLDPALAEALLRRLSELKAAAATDELTGLLRRGAGVPALARELRRAERQRDQRLTVAFLDLHALKQVNDREGHAAGDALLRTLAETLAQGLRAYDVIIRWGGDEFVLGLAADLGQAETILTRLAESFGGATSHRFHFGLAQLQPGEAVADLVVRADADLYARRRGSGRDR